MARALFPTPPAESSCKHPPSKSSLEQLIWIAGYRTHAACRATILKLYVGRSYLAFGTMHIKTVFARQCSVYQVALIQQSWRVGPLHDWADPTRAGAL